MKQYICDTKAKIDREKMFYYVDRLELELSPVVVTEMFLTEISNTETIVAINKLDYLLMLNMIKELINLIDEAE